MSDEKKFIQGVFVNERKNAPDFVRAKLSISVDRFIEFAQANKDEKGYFKFDILESKGGKDYAMVNDWKPKGENSSSSAPSQDSSIDDSLPF